ncbi:hypothetical protein KP79_PYT19667 [Mizuhopecten yessoensis]|uniref:Uncharacterized protein n=1 Tax=Mizuhopecten yessoensis TaxID=6573 RepID=A0A210PTZ6_MIZYE|nr:hypothetical protein KP79_PYT19667 [Mizuhopecten yessoensis]
MKLQTFSLFIIVGLISSITQPTKADGTYLDCQYTCTQWFFECTDELECASKSDVCLECCYNVQDMCSNKCDRKFPNDVMFRREPLITPGQRYEGTRTTGNEAIKKRFQTLTGALKKSLDAGKASENGAVGKRNENLLKMIGKAWIQK